MFQHLVLSPTILEKILEVSPENRSAFFRSLYTESILSDESRAILKEYILAIEAMPEGPKGYMKYIYPDLLARVQLVPGVASGVRDKSKFSLLETEKKIAETDNWRIVLIDPLQAATKMSMKLSRDIEVLDISEYLHPSPESRVRAVQRFHLRPGEQFDLVNWIKKYISDSKRLLLRDGYFVNKSALRDVRKFLLAVNRDIPIHFETLSDEARNNGQPDGVKVGDALRKLISDLNLTNTTISLHSSKKDLRDRVLATDRFHINLGHSLGCANIETGKIERDAVIEVSEIGADTIILR
jgi:hypothetical protein